MEILPINDTPVTQQSTTQTAQSGFGLAFEDLLQIVLTQLTYQDPLKPLENFEFVSQLAQFSQIQQTTEMSQQLQSMFQLDVVGQSISVLGKEVTIPVGQSLQDGTVTGVRFDQGEPIMSVEIGNSTLNVRMANIAAIRVEE